MLGLLVRALAPPRATRRPLPRQRLDLPRRVLVTACARLGITLLHAKPYDAPARGKMERFWRTLREGCLDLSALASLHDVEVRSSPSSTSTTTRRRTPRSSARAPGAVFAAAPRVPSSLDEEKLRDALTVRERRRVRRDTTVPSAASTGSSTRASSPAASSPSLAASSTPTSRRGSSTRASASRCIPVDPIKNARRKRPPADGPCAAPQPTRHVPFDPPARPARQAVGRRCRERATHDRAYLAAFGLAARPSRRRSPTTTSGCPPPRRPRRRARARPSTSATVCSPASPASARPACCARLRQRCPQPASG